LGERKKQKIRPQKTANSLPGRALTEKGNWGGVRKGRGIERDGRILRPSKKVGEKSKKRGRWKTEFRANRVLRGDSEKALGFPRI